MKLHLITSKPLQLDHARARSCIWSRANISCLITSRHVLWIWCNTLPRWLEAVSSTLVEMVTRTKNRPGQILNLHTHRYAQSTRKISWTDLPRVYHNAQVIYVSGSRVCSCSSRRLPAISRILSLHTLPSRQQGTWKVSWTDYASRRNHAQAISVVSYRHTEPRTALLAQNQQPAQPYSPTEIDA